MIRQLTIASLAVSMFVGACDNKSTSNAASSTPTGSSAVEAKKAGPEKDAFFMGRKLAFSGAFELSGAKDKAGTALTEAQAFAKKLEVGTPSGSEDADIKLSAAEIKAKHGEKAEATFLFGYYLTDAWFGAELGAKVDVPLERAAKNAAASGIPESVWKAKLDAIKAAPKSDAIAALAKDIEVYFK
ncbi:MAG: hypothetical protein HOW73_15555 [Polyangiaceae bacterium]|nr:hypothetical protein [Polyangiaceae bacterium]